MISVIAQAGSKNIQYFISLMDVHYVALVCGDYTIKLNLNFGKPRAVETYDGTGDVGQ